MKKLFLVQLVLMSLFLTACTSAMFDKTAQAYKDSAKELESATSQDEYDRIHDDLLRKLYDITLEYPNWEEIIQKEGKESSAVKKVNEAYDTWNETLKEKVGKRYFFMTFCSFDVAIDKYGGDSSKDEDTSKEESENTGYSKDDMDKNEIDRYLASYEEYCNKYISFMKKAADGDIEAVTKYTELLKETEDFGKKIEQSEGEMTSEQLARFQKIQAKLINATSEIE